MRYIILGLLISFSSFAEDNLITCRDSICRVYLTDSIEGVNDYLKVADLFNRLTQESTIELHLAGYGGRVDGAVYLATAIHNSKAHVVTYVDGPVYSCHAILATLTKDRVVSPYAFMMFHKPAVLISGEYTSDELKICKGEKNKKDRGTSAYTKCLQGNRINSKSIDVLIKDTAFKYLTAEEQELYNEGYEIYLMPERFYNQLITVEIK